MTLTLLEATQGACALAIIIFTLDWFASEWWAWWRVPVAIAISGAFFVSIGAGFAESFIPAVMAIGVCNAVAWFWAVVRVLLIKRRHSVNHRNPYDWRSL